jgi:hypothetical protein
MKHSPNCNRFAAFPSMSQDITYLQRMNPTPNQNPACSFPAAAGFRAVTVHIVQEYNRLVINLSSLTICT